jgi:DNA-directed RNA polymerase subunit K/omega
MSDYSSSYNSTPNNSDDEEDETVLPIISSSRPEILPISKKIAMIEQEGSDSEIDPMSDDEDIPEDGKFDEPVEDTEEFTQAFGHLSASSGAKVMHELYDEEDESSDDDEDYLKKFNKQVTKNVILDFHPECITHNYDEITAMSNVIKDTDGNVIDAFHKTLPFLTKFEETRIIGQRAKQINNGSTPFVKVPQGIIDGAVIAELELRAKKIPFIIKRPLSGGGCEYWKVKDLENINF